jgi:hypothetical protein
MFEAVKVDFSRGGVQLGELDTGIGKVGGASCHSPNQFANAGTIFDLHGRFKLCNDLGIIRASGTIEALDPLFVPRRKWYIP